MIVVDTSVLIKFVVPEPRADLAYRLRGEVLAAPAIWQAEAGNVLWRKVRIGELTETQAATRLEELLGGAIETLSADDGIENAFQLSLSMRHPIYDCLFLQAAIDHDTYVVTDDGRFAKAARRHGKYAPRIRLLTDI